MSEEFAFVIYEDQVGQRIDKVIADFDGGLSRNFVQNLIAVGAVSVNGKSVTKSYKMEEGDTVSVQLPDPEPLDICPEDIPLDIRFEDESVLVVNKPQGMVVHPAPGHACGTLVNALLYHCGSSLSGINGVLRPGIVHRIDKDTSGLLMVAKNDAAHASLASQIQDHSFKREYFAIAHGRFKEESGTVNLPIGRHPRERKKMAVVFQNSKPAVTHYQVLEQFGQFAFLRLRLETGRTHQIRVHMAYLGHPLAGDPLYGPKNGVKQLHGQCLHAGLLGFVHPTQNCYMEITSELPDYFKSFLKKLGGAS